MMSIEDDDGDGERARRPTIKLGDLEALQGVVKFPVRIKCATLAWNTLLEALDRASNLAYDAGTFDDDRAAIPMGSTPAEELIHERAYVVRAYRKGNDQLILRGAVRDQKPPGLYVPTTPSR